jgi:hypothetical protein
LDRPQIIGMGSSVPSMESAPSLLRGEDGLAVDGRPSGRVTTDRRAW